MVEFDWATFLPKRSRDLVQEAIKEAAEYGEDVPEDIAASEWLGYPGAIEEQIAAAEDRLGVTLPLSYRSFLAASNGWHPAVYQDRLWSTEEIEWFAVRHQEWIDIWTRDIDPVSDKDYFGSDTVHLRSEYLQGALEIGEKSSGDIELLIPRIVTNDGEWEHWTFSNSAPGAFRSPSFLVAFADVGGDAHGARHILERDAWPNRSVDAYIDALRASDSRVRRQAAAALEVLGDPRAVEPLIQTLSADEDGDVRWNAARALGKLGQADAVGPLGTPTKSAARPWGCGQHIPP